LNQEKYSILRRKIFLVLHPYDQDICFAVYVTNSFVIELRFQPWITSIPLVKQGTAYVINIFIHEETIEA